MKTAKNKLFQLGFFKTFSKPSLLRLLFIPFLVLAISACADNDDDDDDDEPKKQERPTKPFALNTSLINFELVGNFYRKGSETCNFETNDRLEEIKADGDDFYFADVTPVLRSDDSLRFICRFAEGLKRLKQKYPNLHTDESASDIDTEIQDLLGGSYFYKGGNSIRFGDKNLVQWTADSKRVVARWQSKNANGILDFQTIFYDADKNLYVVIIEDNFFKRRSYSEFWFPTDSRKYLLVKQLRKVDRDETTLAGGQKSVRQLSKDTAYVLVDEDDNNLIVTNFSFPGRETPRDPDYSKFIFSNKNTVWYQRRADILGNNADRQEGTFPDFDSIFDQNLSSFTSIDDQNGMTITFDPEVKNPNGSDTASKVNTLIDDAGDFSPLRNQTYNSLGTNIAGHLGTDPVNSNDPE